MVGDRLGVFDDLNLQALDNKLVNTLASVERVFNSVLGGRIATSVHSSAYGPDSSEISRSGIDVDHMGSCSSKDNRNSNTPRKMISW